MAIVIPTATFLNIPMCDGTWAIQAMSAAGLDPQVTPIGCPHALANVEDRFVFTFVRHPLTWYPSFWKYRWSRAVQSGATDERLRHFARQADEPIDECLVDGLGRPRSFAGFVAACIDRHPGFLSHKFALYTIHAQFVGRLESLCDDLLAALSASGAVFDAGAIRRLPKANVTNEKFAAEYPADLAVGLLRAESAAIQQFYGDLTSAAALTTPA